MFLMFFLKKKHNTSRIIMGENRLYSLLKGQNVTDLNLILLGLYGSCIFRDYSVGLTSCVWWGSSPWLDGSWMLHILAWILHGFCTIWLL